MQISTPQSDEAAYREAVKFLKRHQQLVDGQVANEQNSVLPTGPLSTAALDDRSTIYHTATAPFQNVLVDEGDLQVVPEWESESLPPMDPVEHAFSSSDNESDNPANDNQGPPESLVLSHSQGWPEEDTDPPTQEAAHLMKDLLRPYCPHHLQKNS